MFILLGIFKCGRYKSLSIRAISIDIGFELGQPGSESTLVLIRLCNEMGLPLPYPGQPFRGKVIMNSCFVGCLTCWFCSSLAKTLFKHIGFRLPLVACRTHFLPEATQVSMDTDNGTLVPIYYFCVAFLRLS